MLIAALIFATSLGLLIQFFVAYCRSLITNAYALELSEQAHQVTAFCRLGCRIVFRGHGVIQASVEPGRGDEQCDTGAPARQDGLRLWSFAGDPLKVPGDFLQVETV